MRCHIRFSHGPSHHQNFGSMPALKHSFESLSCSLEQELHESDIIELNVVDIYERSINAMLKLFDWMNVPSSCFCTQNFQK